MTTDPLESPDKTSPFWVNARHVTYLGRSRVVSNIPLRLYKVLPASNVQKLMCPLPQVTIWLRSRGWNSAATTVSIEAWKKQNKNRLTLSFLLDIFVAEVATNLGLRDLMTLVGLLPVPYGYVVVITFVDGAQKTTAVLFEF